MPAIHVRGVVRSTVRMGSCCCCNNNNTCMYYGTGGNRRNGTLACESRSVSHGPAMGSTERSSLPPTVAFRAAQGTASQHGSGGRHRHALPPAWAWAASSNDSRDVKAMLPTESALCQRPLCGVHTQYDTGKQSRLRRATDAVE